MKLSEELKWRGFWNQTTFKDPEILDKEKLTIYLGTDPSADSLHIGHLSVYMMVRRFLDHGHKVILLVGGGTGMIGDMRDTEERDLLSAEKVAKNTEALKKQVSKLFAGQDFEVVNNADWLSKIELIPFLRDIGKNFNMTELISRDFFKSRINNGNGLSFAEFTYTLLQGYDFWYLHKNKGVSLQVGGSDQWGNLLSGVNLIRKKEGDEVFAMTAPLLINRSTGRKFGKSEGGALWLDSSKTSPFKLYQFLLNSDDQSVFEYLKILTTLTKEEIESIEQDHLNNPHLRIAQKALAQNVVEIVHGKDNTKNVISATEVLFGGKEFNSLTSEEINVLKNELPSATKDQAITDILVNSETTKSKGEAKRLISGNAISFNGKKIHEDIEINQSGIVKKGKNNFILVL
ncbi:MAG: tyrosine--tRNA ligase [Candidatus Nanogingivalaceae bacterium]|nr:tyrosine--tRNA ligase [Candidatus Nanogingivalaceae bacterium]